MEGKKFHFIADQAHIIKNVRAALCRGKKFILPPNIVQKWGLSSDVVDFQHLQLLCKHQEHHQLKIAPKLNSGLLQPTHFDKMNVGGALAIFSKEISSALQHLVEFYNYSTDLLTTAKFIEVFRHWFDLVNSRHPGMALSLNKRESHAEAVIFIQMVVDLFQQLKVCLFVISRS
jgi:hypothetical protein